jgi:glycosyltransferase involved in cell wall biosynthesis
MKVSIVIAVLNSHKVVVRQLRHFKAMRLPRDTEIIFVDDGSNPPLHFENCGLRNFKVLATNDKRPWTQGLARNMGAREAKGEFLFFTDIDHILSHEAIMAAREFDGDKMVFTRRFAILDIHGNLVTDRRTLLKFGLNPIRRTGGTHGNTYVIRKEIFGRIGGYDPRYCEQGFHMGGKTMSEERQFNIKWYRLERRGRVKQQVRGPDIFVYPTSKFRLDGDNNPFGLFHQLSLEQVPQPMKE